ncbi:MAG: hydrogenase nickel incorporation protein HypB [Rhodospirillales bacterium]|nr:hydrogenase nickel incorporation protein HypB [Rhodospirillales bacterium]
MCQSCGCASASVSAPPHPATADGAAAGGPTRTIDVRQAILADNDRIAAHNRAHFDAAEVLVVNLMSSPGAGKTALLEATVGALAQRPGGGPRLAVIEGDLETDNDARRIRARGVPAVQITTGGACHLDATMIHDALDDLDLAALDLLFIENVGNLVCPAGFDLGHHHAVALLATTEGDDKPAKYPVLFRTVDLVLISKADLLPYLDDFSTQRAEAAVRALANEAPVFPTSARDGTGLQGWIDWLVARVAQNREALASRPVDAAAHGHVHGGREGLGHAHRPAARHAGADRP